MASVVPEIDIGALVNDNSSIDEQNVVLQHIDDAMKNIGFMSIVNHGVSRELIENMDKVGKDFFYLPHDAKMSIAPRKWNASNSNTYRGYIPSTVFGKECLDIADPSRLEREDSTCFLTEMNKFPPAMTEGDKATIEEYFSTLHELTTKLVEAVFRIYGTDVNQAAELTRRPDTEVTLRLNYYPQQEEGYNPAEISAQDGTKLSCETHTDSGFFTVLYQDLVGGLQVQSPTTKKWFDVPCNRDAFVVNTGMAMQRMTNDRYMATFHRVKMGASERMSIPFFFSGATSSEVDPKILCPDETPKYQSMTWKEFCLSRYAGFKEYQRD